MLKSLFNKALSRTVADDKATLPITHAILSSITSESKQADVDERIKAAFEHEAPVTPEILQAFLLKAALTGKFHLLLAHKDKLLAIAGSHAAIANTIIKLIANTNIEWSNVDARRFQLEALQQLVQDYDLPLSLKFQCMSETFSQKGMPGDLVINNEIACKIFFCDIHKDRKSIPFCLSSYKNYRLKAIFNYLFNLAETFEKNNQADVSKLAEAFPDDQRENFGYFILLCPNELIDNYINALLDKGKDFKKTISHLKALTNFYLDTFPYDSLDSALVIKIKNAFNARENTWSKEQIACIQKIFPNLPKTNFKLGKHPASAATTESKPSESTPAVSAFSSQISQFKVLLGKDALFTSQEVGELKELEEVIHNKVMGSSHS